MSMPTKQAIIDEQQKHISELDMGCDWDEAHLRCWCCGKKGELQRCHMTPASLGGSDNPGNFLLMCAGCHAESPDVSKEVMLAWLKREHSQLHGDRFIRRAWREFNTVFEIDEESIDDESASGRPEEIRQKLLNLVSAHFGAGVSHGTKVWMIQETLKELGVNAEERDGGFWER